jgi:HIRAN domain
MKRIDFINRLIALGGLSFLSGKSIETKQFQKFYLLQSFVRGFQYYDGPSLINEMKEGDMLELVREPDNEYDLSAIALHWNKKKIGFIPAEDNEMLSKLLDIGIPELIGEITVLQPDAAAWENVRLAISVLKEIEAKDQIPSTAVYLTELETPHYRTLKRADQMLTRVYIDKDSEENDLEQVNPIEWMKLNSKSDRVKKLFESSINPTIDYSAQADFLVVNKKRLGNIPGFADQLKALESELYNAGAMFDEDGYVVLSVKKAESYIDRISNMVDVTDKLGRHFLELEF